MSWLCKQNTMYQTEPFQVGNDTIIVDFDNKGNVRDIVRVIKASETHFDVDLLPYHVIENLKKTFPSEIATAIANTKIE